MHLLFARHGETEWNVQRRIQGWRNSDLTELGQRQADCLARRLQDEKLTAIYSSSAGRARETARRTAIRHDLPVTAFDELLENGWGEWEGLTAPEIEAKSPKQWADFVKRGHEEHSDDQADWDNTTLVPGGETLADASRRFASALERIRSAHPADTDRVLVVGHGGTLRLAFTLALGLRPYAVRRFHLDNASLSHIEYRDNKFPVIRLINDSTHWQAEVSLAECAEPAVQE